MAAVNYPPRSKFEYIWLDDSSPKKLRSKTRYMSLPIIEEDAESGASAMKSMEAILAMVPRWTYDGSSTGQAEGNNSDLLLVPVRVVRNPIEKFKINSFIVLCEVYESLTVPHPSNTRYELRKNMPDFHKYEMLFGIEQEYVFMDVMKEKPAGWPEEPEEQGKYYCGVGADKVRGREIAEKHAMACLTAGLMYEGTNAEVLLSQWEYQIGAADALSVADDLWISRYLLESIGEYYNTYVSYDPKPVDGEWNGSGAHVNFSTKKMRTDSDLNYMNSLCSGMEAGHKEAIENSGVGNERRLVGDYETSNMNEFSYSECDRSASIRIPLSTVLRQGKGYVEDRRPAANMDPYQYLHSVMRSVSASEQSINVSI